MISFPRTDDRIGSQGGVIARFGVGYDGVNLSLAAEKGIVVTNTPGALANAVAGGRSRPR